MLVPPFSGSYLPGEVDFLLQQIALEDTPIPTKEALIQTGQKHYSQMLSHETLPSPTYLQLFYQAMAQNQARVAEHLLILANQIVATRPHGITLVSLARAGTPIGVLLKHILEQYFQQTVAHYSISIFRDVGLDQNALHYIAQRHTAESLVFVDGWTGKGVIAKQLEESLAAFNALHDLSIAPELYVLTDLSGHAHISASMEDYLIPSSILNATVSGLVSRSVYDPELMGKTDFHGCLYYHDFASQDVSRFFVDAILQTTDQLWQGDKAQLQPPRIDKHHLQTTAQQFITHLSQHYAITSVNHIKLGIGEATRVLLRREAKLLLLRNAHTDNVQHLHWLAEQKSIPIEIQPNMPYCATAIIKEIAL